MFFHLFNEIIWNSKEYSSVPISIELSHSVIFFFHFFLTIVIHPTASPHAMSVGIQIIQMIFSSL